MHLLITNRVIHAEQKYNDKILAAGIRKLSIRTVDPVTHFQLKMQRELGNGNGYGGGKGYGFTNGRGFSGALLNMSDFKNLSTVCAARGLIIYGTP